MGLEYTILRVFIIRGGFNIGKANENLSFGFGFRYPEYFNDFRLDYAFSYMGVMGINHNFSVYIDFPINKRLVEIHYQKGIYHYIRGEYDLALENWKKALALDPENRLVIRKINELERLFELQRRAEGVD
jgi:tetratricopeptide (TPR) repeat protein